MGHFGGAPVPSHRTWPQSHLTQSIRQSPRIGSQDTQCAPSKVTTRLGWRIHFQARVGAVKRYPEPMAHGPEACEPSHPCGSRRHRLSAGYPWNLISNQ